MKLSFYIDYRTHWGESLYITGDVPVMGDGDESKAVKMELKGEQTWVVTLDVEDSAMRFDYRYLVRNENGGVIREWGPAHKFVRPSSSRPGTIDIYDRWQDQPWDKPFYSSAFVDCICDRVKRDEELLPSKGCLRLSVSAPMVNPRHVVAVSGSSKGLGEWDVKKAVVMNDHAYPTWTAEIPVKGLDAETEYKFLLIDKESGEVVGWEGCDNRVLGFTPAPKATTYVSGLRFVNAQALWRGAGTAIPVFAVRSEEDFGVGDFIDLKKMVDWAAATGQRFIQLLPINDTTMTHTWTDSYPYKANSIFALHPMYLRLDELGELKDAERRKYYKQLAKELNDLREIDYERVNNGKTEYFREIYAQNGRETVESADFNAFVERNHDWLIPYAAFCVLRDRYNTPDFSKWGEYAVYDVARVENLVAANSDEINFICYLQYHLDRQMREVHDYAHSKGVALKGDIPIGISRDSADAWIDPRLFNMDCQAGAPPDDFSVLGQNWGLPTYNWEEMGRDGFAWWKARFRKMAEYFDAYRIDHVLGFFRIWQIPMDAVHGLLGIFNPALPFTPDELRNNYDFWLDVNLQTNPYIMDWMLGDFFGEYTDEVREKYLLTLGDGRYALRDEYKTQRLVVDYFAGQEKNDKNKRICDGLLGLIDQVLFIEDPVEKGKSHPRISAQFTYTYRALNDYERWCFDHLYNDFFYRRLIDFWYGKALWKLPPLIDSTDMLVCAEDLGMIPACVPAVINRLEILSLEIQRMPKDPNVEFGNTWSYPYYSVCTTSTHDMGGIRQWWEEDRAKTQRFYNEVLHLGGEAPVYAEPWICDRIIDLHLKSPSMLCILPLQDWLSTNGAIRRIDPREEQINVPANSRHYWRYRMHLTIEELLADKAFAGYLKSKIEQDGR